MLAELRLSRLDHNLCDVQRLLGGKVMLRVRYTRMHLFVLYIT